MLETPWISSSGAENAAALRALHPEVFAAIAELDRLGHLLLSRVGTSGEANGIDFLVGAGLLRKSVATFVGFRTLAESSAIDPAKALARTHFELWLHYRCFVYGAEGIMLPFTPLIAAERETRARRYYLSAQRRGLRARALLVAPDSQHRAKDVEARDALEKELQEELTRLRTDFRDEWNFFGDVTVARLIAHVAGNDERPWFAASFLPAKVNSIKDLAYSYKAYWEYDFVYDMLSSQIHPRGLSADLTIGDDAVEIHHPNNADWFPVLVYWTTAWHAMLLMAAARAFAPAVERDLQRFDLQHGQAFRALKMDPSVWSLG